MFYHQRCQAIIYNNLISIQDFFWKFTCFCLWLLASYLITQNIVSCQCENLMFCFSHVISFLLQNLTFEVVQWNAVVLFQLLIEFLFLCFVMTHRIGYESLCNLDCKTPFSEVDWLLAISILRSCILIYFRFCFQNYYSCSGLKQELHLLSMSGI